MSGPSVFAARASHESVSQPASHLCGCSLSEAAHYAQKWHGAPGWQPCLPAAAVGRAGRGQTLSIKQHMKTQHQSSGSRDPGILVLPKASSKIS